MGEGVGIAATGAPLGRVSRCTYKDVITRNTANTGFVGLGVGPDKRAVAGCELLTATTAEDRVLWGGGGRGRPQGSTAK